MTGAKGMQWLPARADINANEDIFGLYTVNFKGTFGNSYRGDIAIDNIKFVQGSSCGDLPFGKKRAVLILLMCNSPLMQ